MVMRLIPRPYPQDPVFFSEPDTTMANAEGFKSIFAPDTTMVEPVNSLILKALHVSRASFDVADDAVAPPADRQAPEHFAGLCRLFRSFLHFVQLLACIRADDRS